MGGARMDRINKPHDKFFKETLGDVSVAQDFIHHYLPEEILGIIDISSISPEKDSFITKDLEEYFSDLLFSVTMNGEEGYLYFLFEHKSYEEKNISFQLLKYMIEIWENKLNKEKTDELPIVIPLVIYHGRQKWSMARTLGDLLVGYNNLAPNIQKYVPNYEYLLFDFSFFGGEEIQGNIQLRVFLDVLKHIFVKDVEHLIVVLESASNDVEENLLEIAFFNTIIKYIMNARDDLPKEEVAKRLTDKGREIFMSVADQLRKEGEIKGIEKGIQEGEIKGKKEVAKRMLQLNMNEEQIIAVTGLSKDEIERIKDELTK